MEDRILKEGDCSRWEDQRSTRPSSASALCAWRASRERPIAAVAHDLGIHHETLRSVVRQDEADHGSRSDRLASAEREELAALRHEMPRAAARQRDLKGGECVFRPRARPAPSEVSRFIDAHRDRVGVEPICRELEVSASAYRARQSRPPSDRALRDAFLIEQIRRVHAESQRRLRPAQGLGRAQRGRRAAWHAARSSA